jgi:microsomal dipeptidase-like Zn-dependent dipeptidase
MDVLRCQLCNKELTQEEDICKACLEKQRSFAPQGAASVVKKSTRAFFLKQWLSRRSFLAGTTATLAGLLAPPWRSLFQFNTHSTAASPLRLDFESGDLSFWTAEGEAFLNQLVRGDRFTTSQARPGLVPIGGDYWDGPHPVGHQGDYWISTEDYLTGTLLSDEFSIMKDFPWFSFLISGHDDLAAHNVSLLVRATAANKKTLAGSYPLVRLAGQGAYYKAFEATGHGNEIMRRVSFDATQFAGERARIYIVDSATSGHLNVDDFQFTSAAPQTISTEAGERDITAEVWGFADIHSHPMAHLAFGSIIFWGELDGPIATALPWCTPAHGQGGTGIGTSEGNVLMAFFESTGYGSGIGHLVGGYPQFDGWPRFTTLVHQQMYIDWIRRAYDGGLRLLVAHAVNNELLASQYNGVQPYDDRTAVEQQIAAMKTLVANHSDWMQIAYSSAEARSIIQQNKLAIVLGVEVDSIGNWKDDSAVTEADVTSYLNHLYNDLGVRHLFPIHMTNNVLGGPAIYNDIYNVTNYFLHKDYFQVEDGSPLGIQFRLEVDPGPGPILARVALGYNPPDAEYAQFSQGQVNTAGLTDLGLFFIQTMMSLGMIVEIDHLSQKAVEQTLALAEQNNYPVVAGHTMFRELAWKWEDETQSIHKCANEQSKSATQVERVRNLGGMVAPIVNQVDVRNVGDVIPSLAGKIAADSAGSATSWASAYLYAVEKMGGRGVAVGTDTNGFAKLNGPRFGLNASYYLDSNVAGWDVDPLRRQLRQAQVEAQTNGVRYDKPILDPRHYRFEGVLEGNVYDETDRDIWQAVGLYYAGLNPWTDSSIPDINDAVANFAKGFFATSESQLEQPGLFTGDAPYQQKAAYLVKTGQMPSSSDASETQTLYPKVLAIWQRWLAMQGNNTPLTRSYAGNRDFDINIDGVAHYGMLPDLFQDLKNVGLTDNDLVPLFRSAEDYIQMWSLAEERSAAIRAASGS